MSVVPYQRIELAMPETGEKAEWIRDSRVTSRQEKWADRR